MFSLGPTIKTELKNTNNHSNKIGKRTLKVQGTRKVTRFESREKEIFPHGIFASPLNGPQLEEKAAVRTWK